MKSGHKIGIAALILMMAACQSIGERTTALVIEPGSVIGEGARACRVSDEHSPASAPSAFSPEAITDRNSAEEQTERVAAEARPGGVPAGSARIFHGRSTHHLFSRTTWHGANTDRKC